MDLYANLEINDVKSILKKLVSFIVVDSQRFINKEQQREYINNYLNLLVDITNNAPKLKTSDTCKESLVIEQIHKDLEKFYKS